MTSTGERNEATAGPLPKISSLYVSEANKWPSDHYIRQPTLSIPTTGFSLTGVWTDAIPADPFSFTHYTTAKV